MGLTGVAAGGRMAVTVLGSAGSAPSAGRLCSSVLVRTSTTTLVVDAGNGSIANLQRLVPLAAIDAVVVTHGHIDHAIDLVGVAYALRDDPEWRAADRRLPVLAADGVEELLRGVSRRPFGASAVERVLTFTTVTDGDVVPVGDLVVRLAAAVHPVPAVSVRVEHAGRALVVSGDTGAAAPLVDLARDADLLVCESSWTGAAADHPADLHLTATTAGEVARAAGVGRLVLTHLAGGTDPDLARAEATAAFGGPVAVAEDLATYAV